MQTVEKLQKRCIIKFMEADIHIICVNDMNEGGVQIWSYVQSSVARLPILIDLFIYCVLLFVIIRFYCQCLC